MFGLAWGHKFFWCGFCALALAWVAASGWAQPAEKTPPAPPAPVEKDEKDVLKLKKLPLEELMKIPVTTVSRQESTVGHSPAAVFVITPEMIRRSGATTFPELFRMVPGMQVALIDSSKWGVGVRGFTERFAGKLLVQVDGRTVYNPINAGVYWDTVDYPLEEIERIEVIRGPGASVWGANAVNGIINILTRPAKETQGGFIYGGSGTEERAFSSFRYGGKSGQDLHWRAYGQWFERDHGFNPEGDARDDWRGARGGLRLDWQATPLDTHTFQGDLFDVTSGRRDFRPMPGDPPGVPPFVFTNTEDERSTGGDLFWRWRHELDEEKESDWTLQAYYDRFDRRSTRKNFQFDIDTADLDFQHRFPLGKRQKFIYGLGYRFTGIRFRGSRFDQAFSVGPARAERDRHLFSAFAQDQIALVEDRLSFTVGSKFEHNDFTGFEVQPTGRLLWTPTPRQSAWLAVSRAVRTPAILENDLEVGLLPTSPAPGVTLFPRILPNRDLDSEELWAYELGYRAQITDHLSFDVAAFYHVYHDLFANRAGAPTPGPAPGTLILPLRQQNGLDGETYGVEWAATWRVRPWWRLYGTYSFLEIQLHRDRGFDPGVEVFEGRSPEHQGYLQSSWDLPGHLELDLMGRLVDRLPGFDPAVPGYLSLDIRLGWRPIKNLEVAIVGRNLLDNHHPEFGTSPLLRSPTVEDERAVYGKVTWRF